MTIMDAGAHIVASNALYGGSHNLLGYTLPRFGITTTFVTLVMKTLLEQQYVQRLA